MNIEAYDFNQHNIKIKILLFVKKIMKNSLKLNEGFSGLIVFWYVDR